jgi:hypothetical protein
MVPMPLRDQLTNLGMSFLQNFWSSKLQILRESTFKTAKRRLLDKMSFHSMLACLNKNSRRKKV